MITRIVAAVAVADLGYHVWKVFRSEQELRFRNNFSERVQASRFARGWKWITYSAHGSFSNPNMINSYTVVYTHGAGGSNGGGGGGGYTIGNGGNGS